MGVGTWRVSAAAHPAASVPPSMCCGSSDVGSWACVAQRSAKWAGANHYHSGDAPPGRLHARHGIAWHWPRRSPGNLPLALIFAGDDARDALRVQAHAYGDLAADSRRRDAKTDGYPSMRRSWRFYAGGFCTSTNSSFGTGGSGCSCDEDRIQKSSANAPHKWKSVRRAGSRQMAGSSRQNYLIYISYDRQDPALLVR